MPQIGKTQTNKKKERYSWQSLYFQFSVFLPDLSPMNLAGPHLNFAL